MKKIITLLLLDAAVTGAVSAWLYFNRGADAAIFTGLSIFVAFSPICLTLAEPFTLYLAGRRLADLGVKMNRSTALKALAEVNIVGLPYNRVLTSGEYFITDLIPQGLSQAQLLQMAASAERDAQNILGRTIYDTAVSRALKLQRSTEFTELPGRGVEALIEGSTIRVGNPAWLESLGVSIGAHFKTRIDQLLVKGKTAVIVSTGRVARGIIALKDEANPDAKKFLGEVSRSGLETLLLTIQPRKMANCIAKEFLLNIIRTNLTPDAKAREVQILRAKGNNVAVIGTDRHDLPALQSADVSFLLVGGSLKAEELDDITLDFELPTLESFLPVRATACKFVNVLKLNRRLALASWILLVPPSLMMVLDRPPIPFHPLIVAAGVALFSALILVNSLRTK